MRIGSGRASDSVLLVGRKAWSPRGIVQMIRAFLLVPMLAAPALHAQVTTDGTVGAAVELMGPDFVIPGNLGAHRGTTLFHSFLDFGVPENGSATFTADGLAPGARVDLLVSRVTGGFPSAIDGALRSTVGETSFLFVNPAGVVFGEGATLDVPGSFHVSTADRVEFSDGSYFSASDVAGSQLSIAPPQAFGFLGAPIAPIEVRGFLEVGVGDALSITAGGITIEGDPSTTLPRGVVSSVDGDVTLAAVASAGSITGLFDANESISLEDFSERGDISITNAAIVSSSGISPYFRPLGPQFPTPPGWLAARFRRVDGAVDGLATVVSGGAASMQGDVVMGSDSAGQIFVLRPLDRGGEGAGRIEIAGRDLDIVDADVRSVTAGDGDAGGIGVDLTGDLLIRRDAGIGVGLLARSGFEIVGDQLVISSVDGSLLFEDVRLRLAGAGAGGDIDIVARNVSVEGGGQITASSLGAGQGGRVSVHAAEDVRLAGRSITGIRSSVFSNAESSGDAGDTTIFAGGLLHLADGGEIINQTSSDGDAGDVRVEAGRIEIFDDAKIDSSTSANRLAPTDPGTTTGNGGDLDILAHESITLAGRLSADRFARLGTASKIRSVGAAGEVRVQAPLVTIRDGGGIVVTTDGAGVSGGISIDARRVELSNGGFLAAASTATPDAIGGARPGAAGSIQVGGVAQATHRLESVTISNGEVTTFAALGPDPPDDPAGAEALRQGNIRFSASGPIEVRDGSSIEASVDDGLGGSIDIETSDTVLVRDASSLLARANDAGQGGRIEVTAAAYLRSPDSVVNADAGIGIDGDVVINSPVTRIESDTPVLRSDYLDAASLVRGACEARAAGAGGSLAVSSTAGRPPSAEYSLLALAPLTAAASADSRAEDGSARALLAAGARALERGQPEAAARAFERARLAAEAGGDGPAAVDALRGRAQAQQLRGRFHDSIAVLTAARTEAARLDDGARLAGVLGELANAFVAAGDLEAAELRFVEALSLVSPERDAVLVAVLENSLGNLRSLQGRAQEALDAHRSASMLAGDGPAVRETRALAKANAARSALDAGQAEAALALVTAAVEEASGLASGRSRTATGVHAAKSWSLLAAAGHVPRDRALGAGHAALSDALQSARSVGDERMAAHALGALGALYASEHRSAEALGLTRRALRAASTSVDTAAVWRWSAQEARLLWQQGRADEALAAWRRSVLLVDALREEGRGRYGVPASSFDREISPVYFDFVRALLDSAVRVDDESARDVLLGEVRGTVERYRAAELRDYFNDSCATELASRTSDLDTLLEGSATPTAVVYPIVLEDRLELLVSLAGEIHRFSVDVSAEELERTSASFRALLTRRTTRQYLRPARRLHDWLVAPYAELLDARGVETLVFVPGGALRSIPMAALHDGERHLIERYATAIVPGLSLVDAHPLDVSGTRFLMAGISEGIEGFPALPSVPTEIEAIHREYGGDVLLDSDFESTRFARRIAEDQPGVVHMASHARFTGDPATSFVLAHDGRVSFESISEVMSAAQYRRQPIELLVLSACETAAGNDRASLGLAGLAVRSGARSAVGSLWSISDRASSELLIAFYASLKEPGLSKAEALRRAQRTLLESPVFGHPYYWSAYLMVSNWM